ncbi:MAG: hypothetical protein P8R42_28165 [Candidatus Binatia bacterium]|nr:hypothetical protein [Candidatus Binatia bacterium]
MTERILLIEEDLRLAGMLQTCLGENGLEVERRGEAAGRLDLARRGTRAGIGASAGLTK